MAWGISRDLTRLHDNYLVIFVGEVYCSIDISISVRANLASNEHGTRLMQMSFPRSKLGRI
jgi:hypothetical protein